MFRHSLKVIALSICVFSLSAQKTEIADGSISFHFEGGYGLALPLEYTIQTIKFDDSILNSIAYKTSGGLQIGAGIGIKLRDNFRFLVHAHYQRSDLTTVSDRIQLSNNLISEEPKTFRFYSLSISPLIHYRLTNISYTWKPFFSFGPSLYVYGSEHFTNTFVEEPTYANIYLEGNTKMKMSLGVRATLGLERNITKQLFCSMAMQFRGTYLAPHLRTITKVEVNGTDLTSRYTNSQLQTEYVKEYDVDYGPTPSKPTPTPFATRGYLGADIILGLSYHL